MNYFVCKYKHYLFIYKCLFNLEDCVHNLFANVEFIKEIIVVRDCINICWKGRRILCRQRFEHVNKEHTKAHCTYDLI